MRNQHKKFIHAPAPLSGVVLALACAAGVLIVVEWIPVLTSSPYAAVTRMVFAAALAEPVGSGQGTPALHRSEAMRAQAGTKPDDTRMGERCADSVDAAGMANHRTKGARDGRLALLLDWHANARQGYVFGGDEIACPTGIAAPIPVAVSEAYEAIARFRDAPGPAAATTMRQTSDRTAAKPAFPKMSD